MADQEQAPDAAVTAGKQIGRWLAEPERIAAELADLAEVARLLRCQPGQCARTLIAYLERKEPLP